MSAPLHSTHSPSERANPSERDGSGRWIARRLCLAGHVQGVGFRPFVYRLARELALAGTVQNHRGEVQILVEGPLREVERFTRDVIARSPPLSRPRIVTALQVPTERRREFVILDSMAGEGGRVFVPPDSFTCGDCLAELMDPRNRRYRYPFINCTQCGPRYTLIDALPYDRPNTTMAVFPLCDDCRAEYEDPLDRRFHAEPVACAACGPHIWLEEAAAEPAEPEMPAHGEKALRRAVGLLLSGGIVAVKGVGGYHLLCDATSEEAVTRLRARKRRPDKPLAVMFPQAGRDGLDTVRSDIELTDDEARLLVSPARPIVLARRRPECRLAPLIAPGLAEIGVLLPYSPLHHLLLADAGRPLVATSGNVSGEPVMTEVAAARRHLAPIAEAFLHHDRPIARPADDTVMRCILGRPRTVRLGRGIAPLELDLPWRLEHPILATGGHLKTTVALAWEDRVVVSTHIADMGTARSMEVFAQVAQDLQRLYGVRAAEVACDAHPDYATSRWAEECGLPVMKVWHHHAHASAIAGECGPHQPMLVFAWDGAGLGEDGTLWGGETFLGRPGRWRRVASLRPFRLPGGDLAARAPWRCAAAVCWELGVEPPGPPPSSLVRSAWERDLNCPSTSSIGRLFDAAAALVLGLGETTYEGEAPMLLEAAASRQALPAGSAPMCMPLPMRQDPEGLPRLDWAPVIASLLQSGRSVGSRAALFHSTLTASIVEVAKDQRRSTGVECVGLAGGVFQNRLLTEQAHASLVAEGFRVCVAAQVPCNDGGLSYGQIIELAGRRQRGPRTSEEQ
jgi:hydrogenase maturation protein HypF